MTRVPDAVAVASLDTHRLIVAVPNEGPADIATNYTRQTAADVLRQLADGLDSPAGLCATARATGRPCPIHDAPAPPSAVLLTTSPAEALARGIRQAQRPDGLDRLLAAVAEELPQDDADQAAAGPAGMRTPAERAVDEARQCLAFNAGEPSPALSTLRDLLLDTEERTPAAALATAYVVLAAHARGMAALARERYDATAGQHGVNRGSRGLLTGMNSIRRLLDDLADRLDEQAQQ
ncbi:hypothetical protein [Streptomyces sp. MBT53]|uniref:hypothetical protein n=1 Tax=Streptomyces sp. MBT53 TaxID=1488384 RepID=UPI001F217247|nr:hypothetical protein [Streptomyces sp. MBT53]